MVIEISFPRGGRKPPPTFKAPKARREYELFGSKKKEKPKNKEKKGPKERDTSVIHEDIEATSAQLLTYMSIQNDMVLLGCVREIQRMAIGLSLPGRLSGRVMITKLSESYTQILHSIVGNTEPEEYRSLKQLFKPGQCVACKVITIQSNDDKCRIDLSMMPQDVNSQLSHTNIATGMLLWCAIQSVEEHVYVIDSGIKHCRAFLPKSNLDEDKKLAIGELQWCIVQKCDISPTATTVHLNALTKRVTNTKITKDTSLDHILPGMQVDVTISKILSDGLECKFLNDYTGYICESQLSRVLDKPKFYKIGQIFQARVMYIMPVTKLTFLTFRSLEPYERGDLRDGTLLSCKVLSNTNSGLYLNLGKNQKGYVSYRRLQTELPINSELEDSDIVKRKYPRGSTHQCRILSFDYLDRVYICTLEKDLLKEKVFSYSDLQLGEEVTVEIKEIQPRGLLVEIGRLTGYIQNNQISDMILKSYANIKSKFHNGQKIKAKVFAINEETNSLLFTIKPSFMNSKENLINYDQAELYKQFPGIIKQIYSHGLLVSFFGEVKGWVPKALMSFENIQNPAEVFQIGQMVKCTVLDYHKNSKKLTLSLRPPVEKPDKQKKISENNSKSDEDKVIGRHVGVTVTNVTQLGLEVKINNSTNFAFIPTQQLTKFPSLANLLLGKKKLTLNWKFASSLFNFFS